MIHRIRAWWGTTRQQPDETAAVAPPDDKPVTRPTPHKRRSGDGRTALHQIEVEAPLLAADAVMPSKFAATTIMWAHNEIGRCGEEAKKLLERGDLLEQQRAECRVLAEQLLNRRRDIAAWLRITQFPVPVMAEPEPASVPTPDTGDEPEPVFAPGGPLHEPAYQPHTLLGRQMAKGGATTQRPTAGPWFRDQVDDTLALDGAA